MVSMVLGVDGRTTSVALTAVWPLRESMFSVGLMDVGCWTFGAVLLGSTGIDVVERLAETLIASASKDRR